MVGQAQPLFPLKLLSANPYSWKIVPSRFPSGNWSLFLPAIVKHSVPIKLWNQPDASENRWVRENQQKEKVLAWFELTRKERHFVLYDMNAFGMGLQLA